ncbi:MAG: hypothetical protein JST30_15240 [Armatimonadetes bacterium]|nr:hypothetical protein [Armatimonadota bacterium]
MTLFGRLSAFLVCTAFTAVPSFAQVQEKAVAPEGDGYLTGPFVDTTTRFFPQIDTSVRLWPVTPRNPKRSPAVPGDVPNALPISSAPSKIGPDTGAKFPGMGATVYNPPDPCIAVGYSYIVQVVNSDVAFFNKSGTKLFQQHLDGNGFFSGVAQTDFIFDPRVIFDQTSGRFIVLAIEQDDATQNSGILLAVSATSNPNGNWTKYRINAKISRNSKTYWFDYPGLGYNKDALIVTGNMFSFGGNAYGFVTSYSIKKAGLLSGGTASYNYWFHDNLFTIQPGKCLEGVTATAYGISLKTTSSVAVSAWRNLTGTPSYVETTVTVPSYLNFFGYCTSSGGGTLDALSDRMMDCTFRSGYLLAAHTVKVASNDNRAMVRWYEFSVGSWPTSGSVTRRQSGNIALAAPNNLFMPAICRNGVGGISIILTRCNPTRPADLYGVSHRSTDALNTMGPLSFIASSGHNPGFNSRWGDYQSIVMDPSDAKRFWACGEVLETNGKWGTRITNWMVP